MSIDIPTNMRIRFMDRLEQRAIVWILPSVDVKPPQGKPLNTLHNNVPKDVPDEI